MFTVQQWGREEIRRKLFFVVVVVGSGRVSIKGIAQPLDVTGLWSPSRWQQLHDDFWFSRKEVHPIILALAHFSSEWEAFCVFLKNLVKHKNPILRSALNVAARFEGETCCINVQHALLDSMNIDDTIWMDQVVGKVKRKQVITVSNATLPCLPSTQTQPIMKNEKRRALQSLFKELSNDIEDIIKVLDGVEEPDYQTSESNNP